MAKIVDAPDGQFPTEHQGGNHTVLVLPENCVIPADNRQAFLIISDIGQIRTAGNYIIRVSNPLEKGIVLGRAIEILPEATVISVHQKSLLKMSPEPILGAQTMYDTSTEISIPDRMGARREELKEAAPIRSAIYKSIYQDSFTKYIEKFVLIPRVSLKIKSVKNQIMNLVRGAVSSYQSNGQRSSDINVDEIVNHIYSDLIKNMVFTEVLSKIEWNDKKIEKLFVSQTREFKASFS